ncbi:MAG TPA: cytosine permease [Gaiellaceae bacterium]|nr:cytosine permease [Gaiellaceae bacterium]
MSGSKTPSWGIEPVPDRLRALGALDTGLLWGSLGMSLLVVVAGVLLVPALSLRDALAAILVGAVLGNLMLALAATIGADARVPGMVLLRAPLGRHGSYLATAVNVAQNVGWTIFELIVIATAASALSQRAFGWSGRWAWTLVAAAITTVLALIGPVTFVHQWVRKVAIWVVLASLVYLTWWALDGAALHALWSRPGKGGLSFWAGVDLTIAMPVSWLPLVADYTRFSRSRGASFAGTFVGYLVPNAWLYALGALLLLSRGLADAPSLITAIAGAGAGAGLALVALGIDETKEPFANVYSAAVSIQNLLPRVPQRALICLVAAGSTAGALAIDLTRYQSFLYLLGSVFVPLFGVLLADWLLAGAHYTREDVFGAPALRPGLLAAWVAGFCLYQWLQPVGPAWWTSLVARTHPHALPWGGASLPSFGAALVLALVLGTAARRLATPRPQRA